jgi:hypothetical protein
MSKPLFLLSCSLLVLAGEIAIVPGSGAEGSQAIPPELLSPDPLVRQHAFKQLYESVEARRIDADKTCLAVLAAEDKHPARGIYPPKHLAIRTLGKLKSESAIPLLISEIEYNSGEEIAEDSPFAGMPAVRALYDIGFPAVRQLLGNTHLSGASPEALRRFGLVIRYVFPDAKTARTFVEAYDPGYTDEGRANRAQLLKLLAVTETKPAARASAPATGPAVPPASQAASAPTGPRP